MWVRYGRCNKAVFSNSHSPKIHLDFLTLCGLFKMMVGDLGGLLKLLQSLTNFQESTPIQDTNHMRNEYHAPLSISPVI